MGMTELIFVEPWMKLFVQYYHDALLSQQMLLVIKHVAGDTFVFQQDNTPSHRARTPLNCYSKKHRTSLVLISGHQTAQTLIQWIIRSAMLCSRVYECRMNNVDELKLRIVEVWTSQQNVIDAAVDERKKQLRACVHACRWTHFEHLLWVRVTNKSCGQIKYKSLCLLSKNAALLLSLWVSGLKVSQGKVCTINR